MGKAAQSLVTGKIDELFDRLKVRFLGPSVLDKRIIFQYNPDLTLPAIFMAAAGEEGARADSELLGGLQEIVLKYLDATREQAKARVLNSVTSFLREAQHAGVDTDLQTVLGGQLVDIMRDVDTKVHTIVDAETTTAKNVGAMDGIVRINQQMGIEDPLVYFVVVRDNDLCMECKRLHLRDDGVTPRVWRLSQLSQGYHRLGEDRPSIGGEHPHCRCTLATLMPGYGFTAGGATTYVGPGHDEHRVQNPT
jgi:hypothetical protein